jgi:hypothetical protein
MWWAKLSFEGNTQQQNEILQMRVCQVLQICSVLGLMIRLAQAAKAKVVLDDAAYQSQALQLQIKLANIQL